MKLAKVTRHRNADEQHTQPKRHDVTRAAQIESPNPHNKQIRNHRVEKSPDNIDGGGGKPLSRRLCKWTLKSPARYTGDKVRNGVRRKNAAKKVRHEPKPIHNPAPL